KLLDRIQSLCAATGEAAAAPPRPLPPARTASVEGGTAIINEETLGQLEALGSSPAFVEKLVSVFVADSEALLGKVERALAARNEPEFRSVLHAIKGSSASMGTDRLTGLCRALGRLSD